MIIIIIIIIVSPSMGGLSGSMGAKACPPTPSRAGGRAAFPADAHRTAVLRAGTAWVCVCVCVRAWVGGCVGA